MPIIYVHGVRTRSRDSFLHEVRTYLRRYVAPAISSEPDSVFIEDAYWGDHAVKFAWHGASRPRSRLLRQGAESNPEVSAVEQALMADLLSDRLPQWPQGGEQKPPGGGLTSGREPTPTPVAGDLKLSELSPKDLSDLLAGIIGSAVTKPSQRAGLLIAADEVANDDAIRKGLCEKDSAKEQVDLLIDEIQRRAAKSDVLLPQGVFGEWAAKVRDQTYEVVARARSVPAYAASIFAAEVRPQLNELLSVFMGDVFHYLNDRGDGAAPGPIVNVLLNKLKEARAHQGPRAQEPLVVLSHSMGGQIVYDTVSHFLPADPNLAAVRVDFWCATASQVGFFEEAKLFKASSPEHGKDHMVPLPAKHLGIWWNVWDHNDFLSFTAKDIFDGVDDEAFDSGMSLIKAHGGYLQRPSFYRRFALKLKAAKQNRWGRT